MRARAAALWLAAALASAPAVLLAQPAPSQRSLRDAERDAALAELDKQAAEIGRAHV